MRQDRRAHVVRQAVGQHQPRSLAAQWLHIVRYVNLPSLERNGFVRQTRAEDAGYFVDSGSLVPWTQCAMASPISQFRHGMYGYAFYLPDMNVYSSTSADFLATRPTYLLVRGEWDGILITTTDPGSAQPQDILGFQQTIAYEFSEQRPEPGAPEDNPYRHDWLRYRDGEPHDPDERCYVRLTHQYSTNLARDFVVYRGYAMYDGNYFTLPAGLDPRTVVCDAIPCE